MRRATAKVTLMRHHLGEKDPVHTIDGVADAEESGTCLRLSDARQRTLALFPWNRVVSVEMDWVDVGDAPAESGAEGAAREDAQ